MILNDVLNLRLRQAILEGVLCQMLTLSNGGLTQQNAEEEHEC